MNMVATSRLRHAKEAATVNRPYAQKVSEVVHAIAKNAGMDFSHPLLEKHEDGRKLVFLITSDKGLAGAYSSNACKAAEALIEKADDTDFVIVGRKGVGHFKTRGHKVIKEFIGISEHPSSEAARDIALELIQLYKTGEYREIDMVYTKFVSAISCEPKSGALLPFAPLKAEDQDDLNGTNFAYIGQNGHTDVFEFSISIIDETTGHPIMSRDISFVFIEGFNKPIVPPVG